MHRGHTYISLFICGPCQNESPQHSIHLVSNVSRYSLRWAIHIHIPHSCTNQSSDDVIFISVPPSKTTQCVFHTATLSVKQLSNVTHNITIVCLVPACHSESPNNWRVGRVKDKACSALNVSYPSLGTPERFSLFWGENYCTHHTGRQEHPTRSPRWSIGRWIETGHLETVSPASSNAPLQTWFQMLLMSHSMVRICSPR